MSGEAAQAASARPVGGQVTKETTEKKKRTKQKLSRKNPRKKPPDVRTRRTMEKRRHTIRAGVWGEQDDRGKGGMVREGVRCKRKKKKGKRLCTTQTTRMTKHNNHHAKVARKTDKIQVEQEPRKKKGRKERPLDGGRRIGLGPTTALRETVVLELVPGGIRGNSGWGEKLRTLMHQGGINFIGKNGRRSSGRPYPLL